MATILNSAILESAILYEKNTSLIHSHLTWWWQPSCILPSWILSSLIHPFCSKLWLQLIQSDSNSFILTQLDDGQPSWIQPFYTKNTSLIHSDSTWWWQPYWILPSWIQPFCTKNLHSFILTQLDDGSHPELCHVGFRHCHFGLRHLVIFSPIHSNSLTLTQTNAIWLTRWWQPSWILPSWIQQFCTKKLNWFILT